MLYIQNIYIYTIWIYISNDILLKIALSVPYDLVPDKNFQYPLLEGLDEGNIGCKIFVDLIRNSMHP